jgi:hypothetical protein
MYGKVARGAHRRLTVAGAASLILGVVLLGALPLTSLGADPVHQLVHQVKSTVQQTVTTVTGGAQGGSGGGTASSRPVSSNKATTRATTNHPLTDPPVHGDNPHGQGSDAVVDLGPSTSRPLGGNPDGSDSGEEIIAGRSRGEKNGGTYHGHVTIASVLGIDVLPTDSTPGQDNHGPLASVQSLLDSICSGGSGQLCLTVLAADSKTTDTGSQNHFQGAGAKLGGPTGISANVLSSNGNISESGGCQTSTGDSTVAGVNIGGGALADVAQSNSQTTACQGQAAQQSRSSKVINLGGSGVPIPAAGCANGTPNTATGLPPLAPITCNADSEGQLAIPDGAREALDVFALDLGGAQLVKAMTAGSESAATPPSGGNTCPPVCNNGGGNNGGNNGTGTAGSGNAGAGNNSGLLGSGSSGAGNPNGNATGTGANGLPQCSDGVDNDGDGAIDFPNDSGCSSSSDDSESSLNTNRLAFTGADLLSLAIGGLLLLAGGIVLRRRLEVQ